MKPLNRSTYKVGVGGDHVEIGDLRHRDFKPHVKMHRWDKFASLSVSVPTKNRITPTVVGDQISWHDGDRQVKVYPLGRTHKTFVTDLGYHHTVERHEEGALELEVILKKIPSSNVVEFEIDGKDFDFWYQPELTEAEKEDGVIQPEDITGSYAVYHKTIGNFHPDTATAEKFKTGKAFHIYRPEIIDAKGNTTYGQLSVNRQASKLTITIDKQWLQEASYPVIVDPTFGYTTIGGNAPTTTGDLVYAYRSTGAAGTATSISVYSAKVAGKSNPNAKAALWTQSTLALVTNGVGPSQAITTAGWYTFTFAVSPTISAVDYYIGAIPQTAGAVHSKFYYDATGTTNYGINGQSNSYTTPTNLSADGTTTNQYSMYCTYTASGGGDLSVTVSDTSAVTENVVRMVESYITQSESTTVTDFPAPATNNYQYVRSFTIDHTKVPNTDQSNFPVLVSGTYAYLATIANGGKVYSSNGYDIAFFSDAALTTKLNWEIDTYTASSGAVNFWVKIPTVATATDTVFYMAYAKASQVLIDQSNRTSTWDANYNAVYHLGDGSTLSLVDSTSNNNTLTKVNTPTAGTGQIGGSASVASASSQYLTAADSSSLTWGTGPITVSAWVKGTTITNNASGFFSKDNYNVSVVGVVFNISGTTKFNFEVRGTGSDNQTLGTTTVVAGTWYYVTGVRDGNSPATIRLYVNGTQENTSSEGSANNVNSNALLTIGNLDSKLPSQYWNGVIDEVRASNTNRSADWIKTEYNNQNSPSTFYTVSPELLLINVNDTTAVTDSRTVSFDLNVNKSESSAVTENVVRMVESYITKSESTTVTDFPAPATNNYQNVRSFTIDHTKVGATDSTNFPVLVSGTYAYLATIANGGKVYSSNGYDIAFYSDAALTTKLNWEIDTYTASSGAVNFWVQIPTVSSSVDTIFYMAYAKASNVLIDQSNRTGTWDSNYKIVSHLPNGSSLTASDSTSNANNGTITNATATTGQVDGGASFNGSSAHIAYSSVHVATTLTVSVWLKPTTLSAFQLIAAKWDDVSLPRVWSIVENDGSGNIRIDTSSDGTFNAGNTVTTTNTPLSTGTWTYVVMVTDGTKNYIYTNGTLNKSANVSTAGLFNASHTIEQGTSVWNGGSQWLNGVEDEFRLSATNRSADWILAEYNNQNSPSTFYSVSPELLLVNVSDTTAVTENVVVAKVPQISVSDTTAVSDFPAPASNNYQNVRSFTIDHTKVGSVDSSNFPALVSGTYAYLATTANGGNVFSANGYDIVFFSDLALTTKLNFEIESYTASSGAINAWVQIPTLSHTTDTTFYMGYAKASQVLIDQSNRTGTWDTNFKAVWHLADTTGLDSTSNANTATITNASVVAGEVGNALSFNGTTTNAQVTDSNSLDVTTALTLSIWAKPANLTQTNTYLFGKLNTANNNNVYSMLWEYHNDAVSFYASNSLYGYSSTNSDITLDANWHLIHYTFDGTNWNGYKDGALVNGPFNDAANPPVASTGNLWIGSFNTNTSLFNGTLDELRISNSVRSASWITAEYNNQSSPSTFYAVGLNVTVSDTTTVTENVVVAQALQINKSDTTTVTDNRSLLITELVVNVNDTTAVTESITVSFGFAINVSDTSAVTDAVLLNDVEMEVISDTSTVTDSVQMLVSSNVNVSDSTAVTENVIVSVQAAATDSITVSDTTTVTDTPTLMVESYINKSDTTAVTDSVQVVSESNINVNDSSTVTDSVTVQAQISINVSDASAVSDSVNVVVIAASDFNVSVSDATTVTDSVQMLISSNVNVSDSATVTDTPQVLVISNISVNDSSTVTENEVVAIQSAATDSITVSDTTTVTENIQVLLQSMIAVSDTSAVTDAVLLNDVEMEVISDTSTVTDSVQMLVSSNVNVSDSTAVTENVIVSVQAAATDSITVSDTTTVTDTPTLMVESYINKSDTTTVTDSVQLNDVEMEVISDTTTVTDSVQMLVSSNVNVSETSAVTENVVVSIQSAATDSITVSDSTAVTDTPTLMLESYINKSDATTATDSAQVNGENPLSLSDSTTVTGNAQVQLDLALAVSNSSTVTESISVGVVNASDVNVNVADSTSITDNPNLAFGSEIAVSDTAALTENVQMVMSSSVIVSDVTSITDTTTVVEEDNVNVSDTTSVTENLAVTIIAATDDNITVSDSTSLTDSVSVKFDASLFVSDTSTVTENSIVAIQSTSADSISVSDTTAVSENVAVAIGSVSDLNITVSDTTAVTENVIVIIVTTGDLSLSVSDTSPVSDAVIVVIAQLMTTGLLEFFE